MSGDEVKKPALADAELPDKDFIGLFLEKVQDNVVDEMAFETSLNSDKEGALSLEGMALLFEDLRSVSLTEVDLTLQEGRDHYFYGHSEDHYYWVVRVSRIENPGKDFDVVLTATRADSEASYRDQQDRGGLTIIGHVSSFGEVSVERISGDDGNKVNTFIPKYAPTPEED